MALMIAVSIASLPSMTTNWSTYSPSAPSRRASSNDGVRVELKKKRRSGAPRGRLLLDLTVGRNSRRQVSGLNSLEAFDQQVRRRG
jgi:hypothetical protein